MADITIPVIVDKDRRIVIEVPAGIPLGPAEVVIRSKETLNNNDSNSAREAIRAKLLAADFLVTDIHAPQDTVLLSDEELYQLDQRPPGSKSLDELINEDRGEY
jgi:hypothetical protein